MVCACGAPGLFRVENDAVAQRGGIATCGSGPKCGRCADKEAWKRLANGARRVDVKEWPR